MKFSVFYRLCFRDTFFDKFWAKESSKFSKENVQLIESNLRETMEIIALYVINRNVENLKLLLSRTNAKYARTFYDYFMGTTTKVMSRADLIKTIDMNFNVEEHA